MNSNSDRMVNKSNRNELIHSSKEKREVNEIMTENAANLVPINQEQLIQG